MRPSAKDNHKKYHPLLAEKIANYLSNSLTPVDFKSLCQQFSISEKEQQRELTACLIALQDEGRVILDRSNEYTTPEKLGLITGRVIGHREGFGFLNTGGDSKDLFLMNHQMQSCMHGDLVLAKAGSVDKKGRQEAKIIRTIEGRKEPLVGRFFIENSLAFVVPDDSRIQHEIIIESGNIKGARHGQMVVVELVKRPSKRFSPIGKIKEILGDHMAPGMEIDVALRNYDIPHHWSSKVEREVAKIADEVLEESKVQRRDLRELPLVTIDGEDARDFDDAVYCERKKSGGWRLWVAIADVSHYVRPGTELDNEAQDRGTSVYFPEQVVPMLPEKLSNGLCSLNPNVDRLCMVCEMTVSEAGNLSGYEFYPAVMNSHARFTYTKVGKILEGDEPLRERYATFVPHLETLHQMYNALKTKRSERGAIEFETPEPRFVFNSERKIETIELITRNDAHKLIEECMILANVSAARFVEKHKAQALFRIHEAPEGERLTKFIGFIGELGLTMSFDKNNITPHVYKELIERIEGRPDQELIQTMMLRSMQQAVYSGDNQGHFGLALNGYSHFTSPIRRYPDLILHRAIKSVLVKQKKMHRQDGEHAYSVDEIDKLGEHTSMTERRADEATRDVANWLKCEFMQDHVGSTYGGVISAVTGFGFFVRVHDLYIEGLVHIASLGKDYYVFDNAKQRLIGERTRKVYKLGDEVSIIVAGVNLEDKKIDFKIAPKDAILDKVENKRLDATASDSTTANRKPERKRQSRNEARNEGAANKTEHKQKNKHKQKHKGKPKRKGGSKTQELMEKENSQNTNRKKKSPQSSGKPKGRAAGKGRPKSRVGSSESTASPNSPKRKKRR